MSAKAALVLGMGLGAIVVTAVPVVTTVWYERVYLPLIAGEE